MLIRFWGTRGSIPVALPGAGVRSKIKQALLQANGRRFDDEAAIERFIDEELDFPIRHSYGGNSACIDIVGGAEYMVCDMGSGLRSLGQQIMREHGPGKPQVYNFFMSHVHWDHIMGFPFFPPAYIPGKTRFASMAAIPSRCCRRLFTANSPIPASQWTGRAWERACN
jgi:ribonuclease BN (tRNA processing enzyme)